jgi:hypothetical protein
LLWRGAERGAAVFGHKDRLLKQVLTERFIVTPKTGPTFRALLVAVDDTTLRFVEVAVMESGVARPAQGELFIARANVAYMQRVIVAEKE